MRKLYKADLPISTSMQFDNYITHIVLANNKSIDYDNSDLLLEPNKLTINSSNNNEEEVRNNNFTSSTYSFIQSFIKSQLTNSTNSENSNNSNNNNNNISKTNANYLNLIDNQKLSLNGSLNSQNNINFERY
jgi:hypothetical protein